MECLRAVVLPVAMRIAGDRRGYSAVEYGLIVACVGAAIISTLLRVGANVGAFFQQAASSLGTL